MYKANCDESLTCLADVTAVNIRALALAGVEVDLASIQAHFARAICKPRHVEMESGIRQ